MKYTLAVWPGLHLINAVLALANRVTCLWDLPFHLTSGTRRCARVPHVPVVAASAHGTGRVNAQQVSKRSELARSNVMYICAKLTLLAQKVERGATRGS